MLATTRYGTITDGLPLVIAHGLFGSGRNWGVIAKRLADARPVITVDMRNHGDSFHAAAHDYPALAADLAEVIAEVGGRADVLGHSMGGKAAMTLALRDPDKVGRLIVADIAPVAYGHTQMPYLVAMRDLDLSGLDSRSAAEARLAERVDDPQIRAFLLQSLDVRAARWRLNLPALEAAMPDILGFPELAGRFEGPALFLSGGASDYVLAEHRPRIRALFPHATFVKIPEANHWLHAEKPREVEAALRVFLERTEAAAPSGTG
jgi:pimeloyl-ACP methyl ester carboxylesterase